MLAFGCFLALALSSVENPHAGSKPHIIFVMQDDLGHFDIGIHNPKMYEATQSTEQRISIYTVTKTNCLHTLA